MSPHARSKGPFRLSVSVCQADFLERDAFCGLCRRGVEGLHVVRGVLSVPRLRLSEAGCAAYTLTMSRKTKCLLVGLFLALVCSTPAKDIEFCAYTWTVRSGRGGPGPNAWGENNVWLDSSTNLHLKISQTDGKWSCAEISMRRRLGFGWYQFQTTGRLDRLDDNVVLGFFNYPTGDVGPDATHEIDIEFARWGDAKNPMGNYTVWPVEKSLKQVSRSFPFTLTGDQTTHRFIWSNSQVEFRSMHGHHDDDREGINAWVYSPEEAPRRISQQPMPMHINLWLFKGLAPKNGQEVEVIIHAFKFTPE